MTAREYLDAVRERAEAATDGPWEAYDGLVIDTPRQAWVVNAQYGGDEKNVADAAFIAAARTDVPRLVAALTAVLDLHRSWVHTEEHGPYCVECGETPPCAVVRAITEELTR